MQGFDRMAPGPKNRFLLIAWFAVLLPFCGQAQSVGPSEAMALEQQGKLEEAARAWLAVTQHNPRDAGAFASLGVVLSRLQKYAEAVPVYKRALALDPRLPGIQLNLGLAEFKQGHFLAAITPFRTALVQEPKNVQPRLLLGLSYYGAKRFEKASEHLQIALAADPANIQLRQTLAHSCLWAKNYSCAFEQFKHIQEQDPSSVAAHILTGEALDGLHRTEEAIQEFQAAAKAAPTDPNIHFGIGYLYWRLRRYDEAKASLQEELVIDPGNGQALAYLGDIAMKENDPKKALSYLEQAARLRKDLRIVYLDMGTVLTTLERYADAIAALLHAERLDPSQPDAHYRMARIYQKMGNTAEAQREFAKVSKLREKSDEDLTHKMASSPPPLNP
jgi:tetratricopeptide (TPR) repeat protein